MRFHDTRVTYPRVPTEASPANIRELLEAADALTIQAAADIADVEKAARALIEYVDGLGPAPTDEELLELQTRADSLRSAVD